MTEKNINSPLLALIKELENKKEDISTGRKAELQQLADSIVAELFEYDVARIVFICTHNSRRSQLGQLWLRTACAYYGIENVLTYSGGTESTPSISG